MTAELMILAYLGVIIVAFGAKEFGDKIWEKILKEDWAYMALSFFRNLYAPYYEEHIYKI